MKKNNKLSQHTPDLVQDFQNAINNLIVAERAKLASKDAEFRATQNLASLPASNNLYLDTQDIPASLADKITNDSVNAHLTKIQSQQINSATGQQVITAENNAKQQYIGKKVQITRLKPNVFESIWFDKTTGRYRAGKYNYQNLKGTIQEISFENNLIVVKPTLAARTFVPSRVLINVYVIDIPTMSPNIVIKL